MTAIRSLRISVGSTPAGSLFCTDDGRVHLHFDDAYIADPNRPILSCSYHDRNEAITKAQLSDLTIRFSNGGGEGKLPPFFQNLLPEGLLRKHLIQLANLDPKDEFGLLAFCGESLPGNVYALPEKLDSKSLGRLIGQGRDSYEMSSYQTPTPEAESLSGFQPKVALMLEAGRYVMRSKDADGKHFIGKLPTSDHAQLPEVEFSSLKLAKAAGADVCEAKLLPISDILGTIPFVLSDDAKNFLLVHRFDRDAPTPNHRLHMEDFAQIIGVDPSLKYKGNYAAIGQAILDKSYSGEEDVFELLRRIKINELLGNRDAHMKNFSLLYTDPQRAKLSPAYDVVAYSAYYGGSGHALFFTAAQKEKQLLTPAIIRDLSNIWGISEVKMSAVVAETVDRTMTKWPALIEDLPFKDNQRENVIKRLNENPSVIAWTSRNNRRTKTNQKPDVAATKRTGL